MENNSSTEILQICRTCTKELVNKSLFFNLDFTHADTELTIRQKLYHCIPELDLNIVPNAVICYECAEIVTVLYEVLSKFKNECFHTEMKINKYIQHIQPTDNVVDLKQALQFHHQPYGNLRMEMKTEPFEVIQNFKADESTLYDTNIGNEAGEDTESTQNEYRFLLFNTDNNLITYSIKSESKENVGLNGSIAANNIPEIVVKQDDYVLNVKKESPANMYQCYTCGHKTRSKLKLIVHIKSHAEKKKAARRKSKVGSRMLKKTFKCSVCEYQCNRKTILDIHMRSHTGEKPFKCQICKYECSNSSNLKSHMRIHTGKKPFKCSVCDYQCTLKCHLKIHMRIHTGEKPFKCSVCDYQCTTNGSLKLHTRIHTGEKPFKCSVCNYQCTMKGTLKIHMRIHTGEKPFKCSFCDYRCIMKGRLKIHMLIHTGEKPFKCQICEYYCIQKSNLKYHMRIHTGVN